MLLSIFAVFTTNRDDLGYMGQRPNHAFFPVRLLDDACELTSRPFRPDVLLRERLPAAEHTRFRCGRLWLRSWAVQPPRWLVAGAYRANLVGVRPCFAGRLLNDNSA